MKKQQTWGVVVGRFQVPELHAGHRYLIETAICENDRVLIVLGSSGGFPDLRNPLSFAVRVSMMQSAFPQAEIAEVFDTAGNDTWSAALDALIDRYAGDGAVATLYASRDGFTGCYEGRYAVKSIAPLPAPSGTEVRNAIDPDQDSKAFRAGMIAAQSLRLPISYQTVDIAVVRHPEREILLGRKAQDGGRMRFIGGFVDPGDASLEAAALRELREEAGVTETHEVRYLGSHRIADARYRGSEDGILTAFFVTYLMGGSVRAGDDMETVEWISADRLLDVIAPQHRELALRVLVYLSRSGEA